MIWQKGYSARHRVQLHSYRYPQLASELGAYRVALRRNVRSLLCWDQCRLVIVSSRRQTVHRDQRSRRVQPFYYPGVAYQVA